MLRSMIAHRGGKSGVLRAAVALGLAAGGLAAAPVEAMAESGIMSHYSGLSVTASGRSYSSGDMVAAHKTLPLGSIVRVENTRNGRATTVRIVDRGPYIAGRIIDVSPGVANSLGFNGLAPTRITVLGRGASVGPYDRGGKATGSSSVSVSEDTPKARSKPVRTASIDNTGQGRRRASASGNSDSPSSPRGAFPTDGS